MAAGLQTSRLIRWQLEVALAIHPGSKRLTEEHTELQDTVMCTTPRLPGSQVCTARCSAVSGRCRLQAAR